MDSSQVVLGAVCMRCEFDKDSNLRKFESYIRQAGLAGVQLLVFPEVAVQGYRTRRGGPLSDETTTHLDYYRREGETVPGPTTARIAGLAAEFNMTVQFGMAELNQSRTLLHNSAVIVGPGGVIGIGRKVHNQMDYPLFRPGTAFPVFDTAVGRIGPFICTDLNFPECPRALALQGAQVLTMTTAFPMLGDDPSNDYFGRMYELQAQAAAIANQVWVVQSTQVGRPSDGEPANYYGHSRIVSPFGDVVASCGYEEALVTATVDLVGEIRRHKKLCGDRLSRRKPELYGILADERF